MALFKLPEDCNINDGLEKMRNTPGAVLLDIRTREEYEYAHVPGSINIPTTEIKTILQKIPDKNTPIFMYCLSGGRSTRYEPAFRRLGYTNITNIGGIFEYTGEIERGA